MNSALDRLKTLLRDDWDPLELMPHLPADEYDSYALVVFDCLSAGASVEDIQNYLASTARCQIGVETSGDRERSVAEKAWALVAS